MNNLIEAFKSIKLEDIWIRFLADLKQAFTNPAADFKVTLMVTVIIMVLLTLVIILGIIVYLIATRGKRTIIVTKVKVSETDILINRIILVLFVLTAIVAANYYSERTASCLGCHPPQLEAAALSKTVHKGMRCIECHKLPGVTGYIRQKIDFGRMLAVYYTMRKKENPASGTQRFIGDASCLKCHREIRTRVFEIENRRTSHVGIVGSKFTCADCHSEVAHPGVSQPPRTYSMSKCLTCHDGVREKKECKICHPKYGSGERVVKVKDLPKVELSRELRCYNGCHEEETQCLPCHGVTMPHPEDWVIKSTNLNRHGREAAFTKKNVCWRCHYDGKNYFRPGNQFCGRCHEINFHGPDEQTYWSHQQFSPENCEMLCHPAGFCSRDCHGPVQPRDPLPERVQNSYWRLAPPGVDF